MAAFQAATAVNEGARIILGPLYAQSAVAAGAVVAEREVNEVHVECGATLAGSLLRAGLVDELLIYMAPKIMGDQARGLFHLPELSEMKDSIELNITDIRQLGDDIRLTANVMDKEG